MRATRTSSANSSTAAPGAEPPAGLPGRSNPAAGYGEWPRAEEFVRELGRVRPDDTV